MPSTPCSNLPLTSAPVGGQGVISAALRPSPPAELMADAFNQRVTRHDLQTLKNLNWLNDEVGGTVDGKRRAVLFLCGLSDYLYICSLIKW